MKPQRNLEDLLNSMTPGADYVQLGSLVAEIIEKHNALVKQFNLVLAKLDADAGVTDEDYEGSYEAIDADITPLTDR